MSAGAGADFQIPAAHRGVAFGDFDNDGRIDAVVSVLGAPARVFRNISPGGNHWLILKLEGSRSNRMGLGAQVRLTTPDGRSQWNESTTAVGYASSSDSRVHFGLGANTQVRDIEIRWPSGTKQILTNVPADRIIPVTEPIRSE